MIATLQGVPIDEVDTHVHVRYGSDLPLPSEVAEAISRRQAAHQETLLADDPVGREIAHLEAERENLLDTVWLACSTAQIEDPVVEGRRAAGRRADGARTRGAGDRADHRELKLTPSDLMI